MNFKKSFPILLAVVAFIAACTPKATAPVTDNYPTPVQEDPNLSPCPKFRDSPRANDLENNYVIYRDFIKAQKYDQAFELWQQVYQEAPAADGKRATVFEDGIWFYKRIYSGEQDETKKKEYFDKIMQLFDEMGQCYGNKEWVGARKGFEYYYTFSGVKTDAEVYDLFKTYILHEGLKTQAFAINPFTAILVNRAIAKEIAAEEVQQLDQKIKEIITHNLGVGTGQDLEAWKIVDSYAPVKLSELETIKGFYNCDYYLEKYYPTYLENPNDCDLLRETYSWLKWGGCPEADEKFQALIKAGNEKCATGTGTGIVGQAYKCLQDADYRCAVEKFEAAAAQEYDAVKKASYLLNIAKIYFNHLKNFSKSRQYARDASKVRPNWGEPYLLVGRLYASSGPLCGPGRGWDSQIVTWVAIDEWNKAKSMDSAAAGEANKLINRYLQYMPSKEDIFQRGLSEGAGYFVPCWIQQSTTIRAAKS